MAPLKLALARGFERTGLNRLLRRAQRTLLGPHARAINYHGVPARLADAFEAQLRFYREHFEPVGPEELRALFQGRWPHRRPGLLLSFDDGLRSHADVVAPLLEKHGFPGWFMVPVGFVDTEPAGQARFAAEHHIQIEGEDYADGRLAMSWDDLRRLDGRHVICCHTRSHVRLSAALDAEQLADEIAGAKRQLEEGLGHAVDTFAWVGGEEESYSASAANAIASAGFGWSFMTNHAPIRAQGDPLQLQRGNVEAAFPLELASFTLSGFYDLLYLPKRRRVNRLTATGRA